MDLGSARALAQTGLKQALAAVNPLAMQTCRLLKQQGLSQVCPAVPWLLLAVPLLIAFVVARKIYRAATHKSKMGLGSGANNRWNRRIRTERPKFLSKHHQLEHAWEYASAGATPDMEKAKSGTYGTVTATDGSYGNPLSGHLIGRQTWRPIKNPAKAKAVKAMQSQFTFDPSENANAGDKLLRAQHLAENGGNPMDAEPGEPRGIDTGVTPEEALMAGWDFYAKIQDKTTGHWAGDYGGPMFLLPGLIIACHIAGPSADFAGTEKGSAMLTYIRNHQQADGGWGLHIEGPSTLFPTTLNYIAARLLGVKPDDKLCVAARAFMHAHGGAPYMPQWGKFWLCALNVYSWEGVNPMSPELWLLPMWFPFHPAKMWCHSRMCYLPMSFIYGARCTAKESPIIRALREEIFTPENPYSTCNWDKYRNTCASIDLYAPHHPIMDIALWLLSRYERYTPDFIRKNWLLKKALDFTLRYCEAEDLQTNYCDIGPVNKVVNLLVSFYARGADSEQFKRHLARVDDYLWVAEDGMKMQGYNGSQAWDTSFALQAMAQAGPVVQKKHADTIARAYAYLDASQIKTDVPQRELFFRTASKGGWPFSTNDHGWPIADCTSEGIKGTLAVRTMQLNGTVNVLPPAGKNASAFSDGFGAVRGGLIAPERYYGALDVLVALHNDRKSVATVVPFSDDSSAAASVVGLLGGAIGGAWAAVGKLVGAPLRLVDTLLDGSLGWHSFNKQLDQGNTDCLHNSEAPSTAPSVAFNNPPSPWFLDAKEKKEDRKPFTGRGAQWFGQSVAGWLGLHRKATDDGGWATYEEKRGGDWYELLNPAEVWGDLMVDYTYTELTSACVTGLAAFARHFPEHRTKDVQRMIARGTDYVRAQQRPDGSWYGSWAVCFTYGTWFGVEALIAGGQPVPSSKSVKGGKTPTSPYDMAGGDGAAIRRACSFLLSKQRPDGGWGESYLSCLTKEYHHTQQSQVVNTAWALLALIHAQAPEAHAVRRGIDFLISKQALCGDWAQENVSGIFNRTCSITYTAYRNIFPLWALGAYCNSYKHKLAHPVPLLGSNISLYVPGGVTGVKPGSSSSSSSSSSDAAATNGGAGAAGAAGTGAKKGGAISRSGNAAAGGAGGAGAGPAGTPPTGGTTAINGRKHARRSKSRSAGGPLTKMADLTSADTSSSEDDSESSSSEDEEPQQKKKGGKAAAAAGSGAKKAAASSSASASSSSSSRRGRASSVGRK